MKPKTIVFIHGMYMTPLCWEHWVNYFKTKGYTCLAPAWPGRDRSVAELRAAHPDPELGKLTLSKVLNHLESVIRALPEKPILIGHSMGALAAQLLTQRGLTAACVAIDSAPPFGVFTISWPFVKSNWPHITPFISHAKPIQMSFERFQYTFANSLPLEEQRAAFERYMVPESRRVPVESLTFTSRIDFKKGHAPILLIAGGNDHLIPAALNKINYNKYKRSSSPVDYKEFPGRTHFIIGQKGWEEVAEYISAWVNQSKIFD